MSVRFPYSSARTPPIPAVIVTLSAPGGGNSIPAVSAHLDTAADRSVVARHLSACDGRAAALARLLGVQPTGRVTASGFGGTSLVVPVCRVAIDIPGVGRVEADALAHPSEPFVLIGRDILNLFRVTFDGPNQVVEFH